mmetsp:Transcript_22989/g.91177  ORF Transcript_22989/g.91177 Transcript_22989/m.91177 type:complete len:156 (-) Transcript_22989:250-717(-)
MLRSVSEDPDASDDETAVRWRDDPPSPDDTTDDDENPPTTAAQPAKPRPATSRAQPEPREILLQPEPRRDKSADAIEMLTILDSVTDAGRFSDDDQPPAPSVFRQDAMLLESRRAHARAEFRGTAARPFAPVAPARPQPAPAVKCRGALFTACWT